MDERKLIALQVRRGGLGMLILSESSYLENQNSKSICDSLIRMFVDQNLTKPLPNEPPGKVSYSFIKECDINHKTQLDQLKLSI